MVQEGGKLTFAFAGSSHIYTPDQLTVTERAAFTHGSDTILEHVIIGVPGQRAWQSDIVEVSREPFDLSTSLALELAV
jgi:hypothetical protein